MVPYLDQDLLTKYRSVGEEKVRKVTLGENQWSVWVPLGPQADAIVRREGTCWSPPALPINPKTGTPHLPYSTSAR